MAAPPNKTIRDLSGRWLMDKSLSDPADAVLTLQGIGWLTRKAVGLATVTQTLTCYETPSPTPAQPPILHIDTQQTATGGIKGTTESRTLDWTPRAHSDWLFGTMEAKSRLTSVAALQAASAGQGVVESDAAFLGAGWLPETLEGEVVESYVANAKDGWTAWQVWGFAEVRGERWLVRRFAVRRVDRDEVVLSRMVYAWLGE